MKTHFMNKQRSLLCFILFCFMIFNSTSYAKGYSQLYRGVRPMGMGGAFAAVSDDHNALYYNPAGLAKINSLNMGLFNPTMDLSSNTLDLLDYNLSDFEDPDYVYQFLEDNIGKPFYLKASLNPYVGFNIKNVGVMFSGLISMDWDTQPDSYVDPHLYVDGTIDYGTYGGAGMEMPFLKGLSAGMNLKYLHREGIKGNYDQYEIATAVEDFDDFMDNNGKDGDGFSADFGVLYEREFPWFDAGFAFVGQNLPEMELNDIQPIKTQFNTGVALKKNLKKYKFTFALDWNDIFNNVEEDSDLLKRIHMGLECKFPKFASARIGFNQGYYTLGASFDITRIVRIELATYGEEVGAYASQKEDRRYIAMISFGYH